jgi:hypothetical protein
MGTPPHFPQKKYPINHRTNHPAYDKDRSLTKKMATIGQGRTCTPFFNQKVLTKIMGHARN